MRVKELMTPSPVTCKLDDSADDAVRVMSEQDCGVVPVVDQKGRLRGVVTDRDICLAAHFQGAALSAISIPTVMSRHLWTARPEDDLDEAEGVMRDHQVRRLPVVDDHGCVVGILSFSDVTRGVNRNGATRGPDGQEVLQTITAISEPKPQRHAPM